MSDERDFWIAMRAAHIRQAKLLEQERAYIMEQIAAIEKRFGIEPNNRTREIRVDVNDSIAGAL